MQIQNRVTKEMYFITSTVVDWVDVFTRPVYKHVIIESLEYCQKENHISLIKSKRKNKVEKNKQYIKIFFYL
jgi:hypothetical protein